MAKQTYEEKLARNHFEYIDGDFWAEGMWEELTVETRKRFTERMRFALDKTSGN